MIEFTRKTLGKLAATGVWGGRVLGEWRGMEEELPESNGRFRGDPSRRHFNQVATIRPGGPRYFPLSHFGRNDSRRRYCAIACDIGLRRGELLSLAMDSIQVREEHWVIADLKGNAGNIRTVPVPQWVEAAVDAWSTAAGITEGTVFRSIRMAWFRFLRGAAVSDRSSRSLPWAGLSQLPTRTPRRRTPLTRRIPAPSSGLNNPESHAS